MRFAILAAALALSLSSCGSDSGPKADPTPTGATGTPTPTAVKTATETDSGFKVLSKSELDMALLELNDMPPGFTPDKPGASDTDKTFCDYKTPFHEKIKVAHDFTNDADQAFISVSFRQYATVEQAKTSFGALVSEMKTCRTEKFEGATFKYTVMSAPQLGDGSIGIQVESQGYTIKQNFVVFGPTLIQAGGVGVTAQQIADLLKAQVERYTAAAQP
ncbi:MAG: hypothetical protein ACJ72L_17035 [Marmoricola sp.]